MQSVLASIRGCLLWVCSAECTIVSKQAIFSHIFTRQSLILFCSVCWIWTYIFSTCHGIIGGQLHWCILGNMYFLWAQPRARVDWSHFTHFSQSRRADLFRPSWPKDLTHGFSYLGHIKVKNLFLAKFWCKELSATPERKVFFWPSYNLLAKTGEINLPCGWDYF